MQVPVGEKKLVNQFLDDLGYVWAEETDNPAYTFFLS
jgi:hypothetical protein